VYFQNAKESRRKVKERGRENLGGKESGQKTELGEATCGQIARETDLGILKGKGLFS